MFRSHFLLSQQLSDLPGVRWTGDSHRRSADESPGVQQAEVLHLGPARAIPQARQQVSPETIIGVSIQ